MKGSRTIAVVAAILAAAALAGAAYAGLNGRSSPAKTLTIGVAMPESNDQFYEVIGAGIKAEAKRIHVKAVFVFAQNDSATQDQQVRNFVAQKVDAILISPVDANALAPAYQ